MTREFNKRQRNDPRPSFRAQPSAGRYGQGQPPRAAQSRLNRETVDRAWEKGAPRPFPENRQRGNNRQASANWRNNQRPDYSSPNRSRGDNTYNDRRDYQRGNAQHFERDTQRPRPRSYDGRHFDDQRPRSYNNYRGQEGETYHQGGRQGYRDRPQQRNGPPQFHEREHGYQRRDNDRRFEHNQRGYERTPESRPYRDGQRYGRPYSGPQNRPGGDRPAFRRGPAQHSRDAYRTDEPYNKHNGQYRGTPRYGYERRNPRDEYDPYNGRGDFSRNRRQFEGDYEGLSDNEGFHPPERSREARFRGEQRPDRSGEERERHVTRLPDGRVLKGPRPIQRKNAEFWTEVNEETEGLIQHVQPPVHEEKVADRRAEKRPERQREEAGPARNTRPAPERKPARRVASATRRKQATNKAPAPSGPIPRPSQRGFKWPTS